MTKLLFKSVVFGVVCQNVFKRSIAIIYGFGPGRVRKCMYRGLNIIQKLYDFKCSGVLVGAVNNRMGVLENISGGPKVILKLMKADMSSSAKSRRIVNMV